MSRRTELLLLLASDLAMLAASWAAYYYLRVRSGWIAILGEPVFVEPMVFVAFFWLLLLLLRRTLSVLVCILAAG